MPDTFLTRMKGYNRARVQASVLLGFGIIFLLGALFLQLNPFAVPAGLFFFGLGVLVSAVFNPSRLMIAGVLFTLIGAVIFIAYKPLIPYDNGLAVIAIGLALFSLALLARQGYIGAGALTPGILVFLVGLLLYPPTGRTSAKLLAPFILSLWFPAVALLVLGLVYWFFSSRKGRSSL